MTFPVPTPEGPHFLYEAAPDLFLGRRGRGPLKVVWDTNVLVDYLEHGYALWDGQAPNVMDDDYLAELEGLDFLISLWMVRDIQIHVLPRSLTDAKKKLSSARLHARETAINELTAALSLGGWNSEGEIEVEQSDLVPTAVQAALDSLPDGTDRELVRDALGMDAHVFLTRDENVLRCAEKLKGCRLLLATPLDLLEELVACGAMIAVFQPNTVYWLIPDLQRISHLIRALGPE